MKGEKIANRPGARRTEEDLVYGIARIVFRAYLKKMNPGRDVDEKEVDRFMPEERRRP